VGVIHERRPEILRYGGGVRWLLDALGIKGGLVPQELHEQERGIADRREHTPKPSGYPKLLQHLWHTFGQYRRDVEALSLQEFL
jgi:hypothetical protein